MFQKLGGKLIEEELGRRLVKRAAMAGEDPQGITFGCDTCGLPVAMTILVIPEDDVAAVGTLVE
jgi:hypothetical protein